MASRAWGVGVCCAIALTAAAFAGDTVENAWGTLSIEWGATGCVMIDVALSEGSPLPLEGEPSSWVLTGHAHRFADDLYAWQIHLSQEFDSFMIIPNDFLAAAGFALAEVGVEADTDRLAARLHVEIPEVAFSRPLVAGGDVIDVHAVWLQIEPLFTLSIPDPSIAAADQPAGGGASRVTADGQAGADEEDEAVPEDVEPGYDWFPAQDEYFQGESLAHQFILLDPTTGEPAEWATATINLLRTFEQGPSQIVLFEWLTGDPYTGVFDYRVDTAALEPGTYELIIWASVEPNSRRSLIRITTL